MSSSVTVGGFEVTSNTESASDMIEALTPPKESEKAPRVLSDRGHPIESEKAPVTEAARELGKRGGEASAKAREARAKETDKALDTGMHPVESKPKEEKPVEADKEADKEENPRHSARARVEQATRQLAEERRLNRELMDRLSRLEQFVQPKPQQERRESPTASPDGRPKVDDFATYEEYVEALTDWKTDRKLTEREERNAKERQAREAVETFSRRAGTFYERIDKGAGGDKAQIEEVLPILQNLKTKDMLEPGEPVTAAVDLADEIVDSDRPLEVLRYLSAHPDVYEGLLSSKDAYALRRAFGRMEAMLDQQSAPAEERRPSAAPAPFKPLAPSIQPGEPDFSAEMPFDKYVALRGKGRR